MPFEFQTGDALIHRSKYYPPLVVVFVTYMPGGLYSLVKYIGTSADRDFVMTVVTRSLERMRP